MVKIRKIQQAIMGLDGGEYQEIMNDYLHKDTNYWRFINKTIYKIMMLI